MDCSASHDDVIKKFGHYNVDFKVWLSSGRLGANILVLVALLTQVFTNSVYGCIVYSLSLCSGDLRGPINVFISEKLDIPFFRILFTGFLLHCCLA